MIDKLNNDCQLCIISWLDIRSQLALWKATKNISVRLNDNICWVWRNKKYFLAWVLSEFEDDPVMLDELLSAIGDTFQPPEFLYLTLKQLKLLVNYNFPNVRVLEYEKNDQYSRNNQREFRQLPEIFPGLNSIKISHGRFTAFSFKRFKHLRKLEVWDCYDFFKCVTGHETLEELIIDLNVDEIFFHQYTLQNFPKLHTIAFSSDNLFTNSLYNVNYYTRRTLAERINDIIELSFNKCISRYIDSGLRLPKQLCRLSVINDKDFTVNELQDLIAGSLLKQLDIVDSPVFSSEIQLWNAVSVCPSLKILNISGMKLKNDFFELSRHHMEQALANRSEPLTLHCHNTCVDRHLIEKNFKHPKLNVSFVPLAMKTVYHGYVQIHFRPLNKQTKKINQFDILNEMW